MPSYVIGLDLGQRSVKAAILKGAFRGYEVVDFLSLEVEAIEPEEQSIPEDGPGSIAPSEQPDVGLDTGDPVQELKSSGTPRPVLLAAQRILETIDLPQAVIVASVPSHKISSWLINMPFKDPARIAQTVEFEIENYVPWDLDEVIFDYQTLSSDEPGARLLTAMTPEDTVRETLSGLQSIGVDPLHLSSEAVELARLLPETQECQVILDLGASRTLISAVSNGQATWIRCLDEGASSFGLDGTGRAQWLGKLRSSLISAEQAGTPHIEAVLLCGGASHHEGLLEAVETTLGVPTSQLVLPESPRGAETAPLPESEHALAYSLALKGFAGRRSSGICFRKGKFAHRAASRMNARLAMVGFAALLLVGLGLIASHFVTVNKLNSDLEDRTTRLSSTVLEAFPEVSPTALKTSDGAISILQEQVTAIQWRVEALEGNENSSLTLLRELSKAIPDDIVVDLDEYMVNNEMVRIRGITDSFGSVDKIEAAILDREMFRGAKKSDVNKSRDGKMRFVVTIPRVYEGEEVEG